jgi:hypothetical protein
MVGYRLFLVQLVLNVLEQITLEIKNLGDALERATVGNVF